MFVKAKKIMVDENVHPRRYLNLVCNGTLKRSEVKPSYFSMEPLSNKPYGWRTIPSYVPWTILDYASCLIIIVHCRYSLSFSKYPSLDNYMITLPLGSLR